MGSTTRDPESMTETRRNMGRRILFSHIILKEEIRGLEFGDTTFPGSRPVPRGHSLHIRVCIR